MRCGCDAIRCWLGLEWKKFGVLGTRVRETGWIFFFTGSIFFSCFACLLFAGLVYLEAGRQADRHVDLICTCDSDFYDLAWLGVDDFKNGGSWWTLWSLWPITTRLCGCHGWLIVRYSSRTQSPPLKEEKLHGARGGVLLLDELTGYRRECFERAKVEMDFLGAMQFSESSFDEGGGRNWCDVMIVSRGGIEWCVGWWDDRFFLLSMACSLWGFALVVHCVI